MQAAISPRAAISGGITWIAIALVLGVSGILVDIPAPGPQILIAALTAFAIWIGVSGPLREAVDAIPTQALVGAHILRFIGIVFLVLSARGLLSPLFATRAGWGDIIAAAGALALVVTGPPSTQPRRVAYLAWSVFAMLDLLIAVGTATLVAVRGDIPGVEPLVRAPLVLVPTFFVPLFLASHVVIVRRVLRNAPAA